MKNVERMNELNRSFLELPWDDEEFYANYLAQSYYYIFHSTKLLAFAAAHTSKEQKAYYRRLVSHIREEEGHEILAERDLKNLGRELSEFTEGAFTRALYEPQYYKITKSATSLLGYILALESVAVATFGPLHERTLKRYGSKATSFIRVHAEEDPDHVEKALEEVARLPEEERVLVQENYDQTMESFWVMMTSCLPKSESRFQGAYNQSPVAQL